MYYDPNRLYYAIEVYPSNSQRGRELLKEYYQGLLSLRPGDIIGMGQHTVTQGGKPICGNTIQRPLTWEILDKKDDKLLLISQYILDWDYFDEDGQTWENSYIHSLLNETFYPEWFSADEKKLISPNPDPMFLLSVEEARQYFGEQNRGRAVMLYSEFDEKEDEVLKETVSVACLLEQQNEWWLRSMGEYGPAYVRWDGSIDEKGFNQSADEFGVRPAIWLDLNKLKTLFEG